MQTLTRCARRVAVAVAGLAAACALAVPVAAAHAATSYTPNPNEWWLAKWNVAQQVWPVSEGNGVTVAVLDSGVQGNESDLQGAVKPGSDMLGDSGNGEKDYEQPDGHGTAVAALIAGQGAGGGPVGIAPQAKILPVHVIDPSPGSADNIANGIRYAVAHGAQVINMSIGGPSVSPTDCDPTEQSAVNYALAHNVVVVAGAGDTDKGYGSGPSDPGNCAGVLAVGGVEENGSLWQYSTQGSYVSVAAPADHMVYLGADGRFTTTGMGTSFSSPLVAGAAALIRSKYPTMPWYTVDQRLINTTIHVGPVPNDGTGYGIIDIAKAIDVSGSPVKASAPNPPYERYQAYLKSTGQASAPGKGHGAASSASPAKSSSSGIGVGLIVVIVVVALVIIAGIILLVVLSTRRNRQGPRNPGGPGQYPPGGYAPPPGAQYPAPGQQYPPQAPAQPGQYPPPGQQPGQYPPGPYPPAPPNRPGHNPPSPPSSSGPGQ